MAFPCISGIAALASRERHDFPRRDVDQWLDPNVSNVDKLKPVLTQFSSEEMQAWPVGKAVGNVRNQGPELAEPILLP